VACDHLDTPSSNDTSSTSAAARAYWRTSAATRSGSASMSTMSVSGNTEAAPRASPACVPPLPEQCTMARGVKPKAAHCAAISSSALT
jgi:hypothetical protein